jgi:hypothetical protein
VAQDKSVGTPPRSAISMSAARASSSRGIGGLKPQQSAADHHANGGTAAVDRTQRVGADRVEVVEGAVDMAPWQVASTSAS